LVNGVGTFNTDLNVGNGTTSVSLAINRGSAANGNGLRFQTAATNNWYIGSAATSTNTDLEIYNHNTATTNLRLSYSTGAAIFSSTINAAKGTFVSNNEALKIQSADTNGPYLTISPSTGSDIGYIGSNFYLTSGGAATDLGIRATANMIFDAGGANERMRITSGGNVGIGTNPTGWGTNVTALELPQSVSLYSWNASAVPQLYFGANHYWDGSNWKYKITGQLATLYYQATGQHQWLTAPSGTSNNNITFTQAMTLGTNSGLSIGTPSAAPAQGLLTQGAANFNSTVNATNGYLGGGANFTNIGQASNSPSTISANIGVLANAYAFIDLSTQHPDGGWIDFSKGNGTDYAGRIRYFNSVDQFRFFTAFSGNSALSIGSNGNVGISTNVASYLLTVGQTGTTANTHIQIASSTTGTGSLYFGDTTGGAVGGYAGFVEYSHNSDFMIFGTSSTERMRITSGGNVLIGTTTSVNHPLVVRSNTDANSICLVGRSSDNASSLDFFGSNSSTFLMEMRVDTLSADLNYLQDAPMIFYTNSAPRMRITNNGNLLIGTTDNPGATLHVNGTIRTGAPSGGSAVNWRLGTARAGTVTTNATVRVEIDGVLVDLVARYV
jgi:hypothetical protein